MRYNNIVIVISYQNMQLKWHMYNKAQFNNRKEFCFDLLRDPKSELISPIFHSHTPFCHNVGEKFPKTPKSARKSRFNHENGNRSRGKIVGKLFMADHICKEKK